MAKRNHQLKTFGLPRGTRTGNVRRAKGLEALKKIRNAGGPEHLSFGSTVMQIPELDFAVLIQRFPELNSPDHEINTRAWDKFLRSSDSAPYRVRDTDKPNVVRTSSIIMPSDKQ